MVELEEKISQLESWADGKGLILHGAGGTFCSGSDLSAVRAISNPQVEKQRSSLQYAFAVAICVFAALTLPLCLLLTLS